MKKKKRKIPRQAQIPANWPNAQKSMTTQSTLVDSTLQINLFTQNKANLLKAKMNENLLTTKDYENTRLAGAGKTNPIKANFYISIIAFITPSL